MNLDLPGVLQFIRDGWYSKSGLVTALIAVFITLSGVLLGAGIPLLYVGGGVLVALIVTFVSWRISKRVPRTKKGKIGFVISLDCEDNKQSRQVRSDFIVPLRRLLRSSECGSSFDFIVFRPDLASSIDDVDDAKKLRARTRAHFMLYGQVKERNREGKPVHVIQLDGLVAHKSVPESVQQHFSKEMGELLPQQVDFSKEDELFGFTFTSEWISVVSEYLIGVAAALSHDYDYSEQLFRDAKKHLEQQDKDFDIYAKLMDRIPLRLGDIYFARAKHTYELWRIHGNDEYVRQLGEHLATIDELVGETSKTALLKAVQIFLQERDVKKAIAALKTMKGAAKGTLPSSIVGSWNYSMAFLHGYDGDMAGAIRHYRKAVKSIVEPDVLSQVEDFLFMVLEREPEKFQIHYCLGFFYWQAKGDNPSAIRHFHEFVHECPTGIFRKETELAEQWLQEIAHEANDTVLA